MKTTHRVFFKNAKKMDAVDSESIDLVVTSPPYPMIEMWDAVFAENNPEIPLALKENKGVLAFELMHRALDRVWDEVVRVLKTGGFACINIGDAARTINGNFMLYPNHSRILASLFQKGLSPLPAVIWRKQTNAPNKFMGSGVLPAGAYVTLEHEYILILRKGGKAGNLQVLNHVLCVRTALCSGKSGISGFQMSGWTSRVHGRISLTGISDSEAVHFPLNCRIV